MPRHVSAAAVLCAGLLGLAACTDDEGTAQPTESQQTATTTTTTQPSTTPPPTPEEEAASAALEVVEGYWQVVQAAQQAPAARDWEPELRQYAGDAPTAAWLATVQSYLENGDRREGENTIEPAVRGVDLAAAPQPMVMVTACFDSTGAETVDAETGEPTGLDPEPKFPRWELRLTVLQYPEREGSPWLVADSEALTDVQC